MTSKTARAEAQLERVDSGIAEQANLVWEQIVSVVDLITPGGRQSLSSANVLGVLVVVLSVLCAISSQLDRTLSLLPHQTVFSPVAHCPIPFCWNVATAHFFDPNLFKAAIATPCIMALARRLDQLWSAKAIVLHIMFTVTCSGVTFFLMELIHVYRTHRERDFFIPVRGCAGLIMALAHGVRHAYPLEALPLVPRSIGARYHHVPFALAVFAGCCGFVAPQIAQDWWFAELAFFYGWVYLRYMMWFPHSQAHGDHSSDYTFAGVFPRPLRPLIGCVGALAHALVALVAPSFVRLREQEDGSPTDRGSHMMVCDPSRLESGQGGAAACAPVLTGRSIDFSTPPSTVPAGPGSQEYAARRAKALALLDKNIDSFLLAPQRSSQKELVLPPRPGGRPAVDTRDVVADPTIGLAPRASLVTSAGSTAVAAGNSGLQRAPIAAHAAGAAAVPDVGTGSNGALPPCPPLPDVGTGS